LGVKVAAKRWLIGLGVATLALAGFARAQALDPILVRQGGFDFMGAIAGDMKRAVDAGTEVKPFMDGADAIAGWAEIIPSLFPAGSEKGHDTKAKPEIWSDRAGFEKAAAKLGEEAKKLCAAAKEGDKAAFAAAFKAVGQACGACHRGYRVKDS
jgi:cytochrome c556